MSIPLKVTVQPLYSVDQFTARLDHLRHDAQARLTLAVRDHDGTVEEVDLWKGIAEQLEIVLKMVRSAKEETG